jgi:arginine N-succinyltransferase
MNDFVARPASAADLPALAALQRLHGRNHAPQLPQQPHERLWVVEDRASDRAQPGILASARLRPAIGLDLPRYWYHVGCTVHAASELRLFHRQRTLLLGNDHTGASELADLAWAEDGVPLAEQAAALRLVVDSALLAMARERAAYAPQLIAELPGPRDAAGQSPFWAGLGRHFYSGDPLHAEGQHGSAWCSHVAALLPRHPVIVSFLPAAAQAAIAHLAPTALLLRELLEASGLRYGHHVGIADGGPVLEADLDQLPAVTQARVWRVAEEGSGGSTHLVMNAAGVALHCVAAVAGAALLLPAAARQALGLAPGDSVWATPR